MRDAVCIVTVMELAYKNITYAEICIHTPPIGDTNSPLISSCPSARHVDVGVFGALTSPKIGEHPDETAEQLLEIEYLNTLAIGYPSS